MLQHGRTLKTSCQVKHARHKTIKIAWFHLYEVSRINKFIETESRIEVTKYRGEGRQKQGGKFKEMSFCLIN